LFVLALLALAASGQAHATCVQTNPPPFTEVLCSAENAAFLITGEDPPEDFFLLGAGLSYHPNAADEIFVRYDGAWAADDTRGNAVTTGAKFHW
jgi:hypothetical protein